ncbi:hypothetical protein FB451DRAFT_1393124 [Mycena latifolia]|nr:hypothetical protein FB451DRAFT_1393124 [Mycena latifolia]
MSSSRPRGHPPARGHGRGRGGKTGTKCAIPDSDTEFAPAKAPKKAKATPAPIKPRVLPDHEKQVVNPADAAKQLDARRDAEAKLEAAIAAVAAIQAEEDAARAEEEENAVFGLNDLPMDVDEDAPILTITEEDFDRIEGQDDERVEDDDAYLSVPEYDQPKVSVQKKGRKAAKPAKGQTRVAIDAAAKSLVEEKKKAVKKKGVQNSDATTASRKAGLIPNWPKNTKQETSRAASTPESPKLGGLTDEDAAAERPAFEPNTKAPRKNEVNIEVAYDISSNTDETPSKLLEVQVKAKPARKPQLSTRPSAAVKIPALSVTNHPTPSIKSEPSSSSFTPDSVADVKGLPAFTGPSWTTCFLPALYRALYLCHNPMVMGTVGDDLDHPGKDTIKVMQGVLDRVYPGNTWTLKWGDAICAKAVSHILPRPRLPNPGARKTHLIASDARYMRQMNGPAFHKELSPKSVIKLKPEGPWICETAQFIKGDHFTVTVTETPEGDVVDFSTLAAATVEQGYKMHLTGVHATKVPSFSSLKDGNAVKGFIKSIRGLKSSQWTSILAACGTQITEAMALPAELEEDLLDSIREHMYDPSSP